MMYLKVSLKVCEACGCLWFRSQNNGDVYCSACAHRMKDFPKPTMRTRGRRSRKVRTGVCMGGER